MMRLSTTLAGLLLLAACSAPPVEPTRSLSDAQVKALECRAVLAHWGPWLHPHAASKPYALFANPVLSGLPLPIDLERYDLKHDENGEKLPLLKYLRDERALRKLSAEADRRRLQPSPPNDCTKIFATAGLHPAPTYEEQTRLVRTGWRIIVLGQARPILLDDGWASFRSYLFQCVPSERDPELIDASLGSYLEVAQSAQSGWRKPTGVPVTLGMTRREPVKSCSPG